MKAFFNILFIVLLLQIKVQAQNCFIKSVSEVCVGDFIGFEDSGNFVNPVSYTWDLGDGFSSTQKSPKISYSIWGPKTISLEIKNSSGQTCKVTKQIQVNPLPRANFVIDSSTNFCLSQNNICLRDLSQAGPANYALNQRFILWGDGAFDQANLPGNPVQCHKYTREGNYTVQLRVRDIKGCFKDTVFTTRVFKDTKAQISISSNRDCDSNYVCAENFTAVDSNKIKSFVWDFGDGTRDTINFKRVCKTYFGTQVYNFKFSLVDENGCKSDFSYFVPPKRADFKFNIVKNQYQICSNNPSPFTFENQSNINYDRYIWSYLDSISGLSYPIGLSNPQSFSFNSLGKKYIALTLWQGTCFKTFAFDSVEVIGIRPEIDIKNAAQCSNQDTVYFCNKTTSYKADNYYVFWDFKDPNAPQCTTDTKKGINVNQNCNFSWDRDGKHKYINPQNCQNFTYKIFDTIVNCGVERSGSLSFGIPDTTGFTLNHTYIEPCFGTSVLREYTFQPKFANSSCYNVRINYDSAANPNMFNDAPFKKAYASTADPDGWVTIGIIIENGSFDRFSSCSNKTNDGVRCADTLWFHKYLKISKPADTSIFTSSLAGCNPLGVNLSFADSIQNNLRKVFYEWGDNQVDSVIFNGPDTIKNIQHQYSGFGIYNLNIRMETDSGCIDFISREVKVGFYRNVFYDSMVCLGQQVLLLDTVSYFDNSYAYWRDASRASAGKEKIEWDFGDGNGFSKFGPFPVISYPARGIYEVKMLVKDSLNCRDTLKFNIYVDGVKAGVKEINRSILCSEIVQFYDSSSIPNSFVGDTVVAWFWDFGDNTNPSYLKDPVHFYSVFGDFTVTHVVFTKMGCIDTVRILVRVEGPEPQWKFASDSIGCAPFTVTFDNISRKVKEYIWYMGDINNTIISTDSDTPIIFTYNEPGTYFIRLYGGDSVYNPSTGLNQFCQSFFPNPLNKKVVVLPIPAVNFTIPEKVCIGQLFLLNDRSDTIYDRFKWYFFDDEDSVISVNGTGSYSFDSSGIFNISYRPSYDTSKNLRYCAAETQKSIEVSNVKAYFELDTPVVEPDFCFSNLSNNAVKYYWDFGHEASGVFNFSDEVNPCHSYDNDTGVFRVCLIAENDIGCKDTFCREVQNSFYSYVKIPNVFTPSSIEKLNDAFDIDIFGEVSYDLEIINRYGSLVFKGDRDGEKNDGINWNGTIMNNGDICPAGVYFVKFRYQLRGRDPETYFGTVTIIRK